MQLNYKTLGSGQALIILHGLFGSLDNWMTLAKKWSDTYQVFLIDQRNHGQSPHTEDFDYKLMAKDLELFVAEHQIEQPIILGHSMGGKTAMEFAMHNQNNLKKLIVVDIAPVAYEVSHYGIIDALNAVDLDRISSRKEADEVLSQNIKEMGVRQFLLKNLYWKEKGRLAWRFNLEVLEKEIIPISDWDISVGEYEGPTMFIKGENSAYILPQYASEIQDKFPNYELEVVSEAGHWVHAEQPILFYELVSNFMKD